jgi:hypothetical protein
MHEGIKGEIKTRHCVAPKSQNLSTHFVDKRINVESRFSNGCARTLIYRRIRQDEIE